MKELPLVSICMITYGHENYIREAIEGVLMQQCNFDLELIIANDFSPDNTDDIIQRIINDDPRASIIKYIKHDKNIGMMPNFVYALQQCKGKYIALCEGDDYWIDEYKLKKQVDILDADMSLVACYHNSKLVDLDGKIILESFLSENYKKNYDMSEMMTKAALNTLLGMGTVFAILIIIVICLSIMSAILKAVTGKPKTKKEQVSETAASNTINNIVAQEENQTDDTELVAVITAAIAASEGTSGDDFVVRSIIRRW